MPWCRVLVLKREIAEVYTNVIQQILGCRARKKNSENFTNQLILAVDLKHQSSAISTLEKYFFLFSLDICNCNNTNTLRKKT